MITKLFQLLSVKNITSYVVCLNTEKFSGKIKNNGVTYKIPVIKLESDKNDVVINNFIEQNNISKGEILLSASNLVYMPKLNIVGIGFKIEKKKHLNIVFNLSDQLHIVYLAGLLMSKSLLVVNNKDLESTMNINFKDEENEFTNKANELLPIIIEKIGLKYLKEDPRFKDFNKNQVAQFFEENPNYLAAILKETTSTWI
ncbi:hypothetical protein [Flavobacterium sp. LC2016-01]|uniref:hypothetical protein n=1 Tax=Flavobacterium sp. LC2016-01 TaxID=2675876 RepID=UPI0012BA5BA9|nr:hypothetical protein [Flavobacterium sp. LC2016-01]MTH16387.1 hypothetical protein [Flavobacterium sp. LC2016-01]